MNGFSIIIPTLNRTSYVINTLHNVLEQEIELDFEIIVIDQSTEADIELIRLNENYSIVKYHHITFFKGLPEARNYGASKANYKYLLFLDDDIECKSDLLKEHYKLIQKPEIGVVAGGITEKFKNNIDTKVGWFQKIWGDPKRGFHQDGQFEVDHAGGGNFSVKKSLFDNVGGIDELLTKGAALYEETDFCLRIKKSGYKIFYNHKAHMVHLAAPMGGCRVEDIDKYLFSLSRNRTIIIRRYLPWYFRITASLYLKKLAIAYTLFYKSFRLYKSYRKGIEEGKKIALLTTKRSYLD